VGAHPWGRSLLIALVSPLAACAVSTPFRWPGLALVRAAGSREVLLVLTSAEVAPEHRASFRERTLQVAGTMEGADGLVGWSIRTQLFGGEVWTATVWTSPEAAAAWSRSPVHQAAIAAQQGGFHGLRLKRLWLPADDLPLDWARVLTMLGERR
jgi:heme-degrading monooxygenase HmoA